MDKHVWRWATPKDHDEDHDKRQVEYWLSRTVEERLAQAEHYRLVVHGADRRLDRSAWRWGVLADLDRP
jgi:hypothetical protein